MKPCLHCEERTHEECICGHAYCSACQRLYKSKLCPMCLRVKQFQEEQAMLNRVVPWQAVNADTSLLLSVGRHVEPGAVTIPVPVEIRL
jgi:hypothetical protein